MVGVVSTNSLDKITVLSKPDGDPSEMGKGSRQLHYHTDQRKKAESERTTKIQALPQRHRLPRHPRRGLRLHRQGIKGQGGLASSDSYSARIYLLALIGKTHANQPIPRTPFLGRLSAILHRRVQSPIREGDFFLASASRGQSPGRDC